MNLKSNGTTWSDEPQAQRDWYNGIEFRSKLESKTAQALDNLGIKYEYEPDGYKLSNGMWYKPDFWLPRANQYVECKGKMKDTDSAKIAGLVDDTSRPIVVISYKNAILIMRHRNEPGEAIKTYTKDVIRLVECKKCGVKWFVSMGNTFKCPQCGADNGSEHLMWLTAVASGQQLFEYSQEMVANKPLYREISKKFNG